MRKFMRMVLLAIVLVFCTAGACNDYRWEDSTNTGPDTNPIVVTTVP